MEVIASGSLIGYDREPAFIQGLAAVGLPPHELISASAPIVTLRRLRRCAPDLAWASVKSRSPCAIQNFARCFQPLPLALTPGW